jgi:diguanylate cyclase (GGDEF)-like protein
MWVRGIAPNGNRRVDGVVTDITARKLAELELVRLAQHDSLTKLANRRQFDDHLDRELAALPDGDGDNAGLALLLLDLDRFKEVNDSLGHIAGDELLLAAARRISSCLRSVDLAARFGGDEFAVILTDVDVAGAALVADRIRDAIAAPFSIDGKAVVETASIGLAHVAHPVPRHALVSAADAAMYDAKAAGRNRVVTADEAAASRTGWPTTRR